MNLTKNNVSVKLQRKYKTPLRGQFCGTLLRLCVKNICLKIMTHNSLKENSMFKKSQKPQGMLQLLKEKAARGDATLEERYELGLAYYLTNNMKEAKKHFAFLARLQYKPACCFLGWLYETGELRTRLGDKAELESYEALINQAEQYYLKAAYPQDSDMVAAYRLGRLYETCKPDGGRRRADEYFDSAVIYYKKAAEKGHAKAQHALGRLYEKSGSDAEAINWYNRAINSYKEAYRLGDKTSSYRLGCLYANSKLLKNIEKAAFEWYQRAGAKGHIKALYELGSAKTHGLGTEKNEEEAVCLYKLAADPKGAKSRSGDASIVIKGYAKAQHALGLAYTNGRGVAKDKVLAEFWLKQSEINESAKQSNKNRAHNTAEVNPQQGLSYGALKNAKALYIDAASQGDAEAQFALGKILEIGCMVITPVDGKEKLDKYKNKVNDYYEKAARTHASWEGYAPAQFALAKIYANSELAAKNDEQAVCLYKYASQNGHTEASYLLGEYYYDCFKKNREQNNSESALTYYKQAILQSRVNALEYKESMRPRVRSLSAERFKEQEKLGSLAHSKLMRLLKEKNTGKFVQGKEIGRGGYAIVYEGTLDGEEVAIKTPIRKQPDLTRPEIEIFEKEISILASLNHSSIVKLYTYTSKPIRIVMEYCPQGSLKSYLHATPQADLPWTDRFRMAYQLARGLTYLHKQLLVHQDIKSENILIDKEGNVKFSDFGLSMFKDNLTSLVHPSNTFIPHGTIRWLSPQNAKGQIDCARSEDIYSFGVLLWEIATHQTPYNGLSTKSDIMDAIKAGRTNPIPENTHPRFAAAISNCFHYNPKVRPTAKDLTAYFKKEIDAPLEWTINANPNVYHPSNNNNNNNSNNIISVPQITNLSTLITIQHINSNLPNISQLLDATFLPPPRNNTNVSNANAAKKINLRKSI